MSPHQQTDANVRGTANIPRDAVVIPGNRLRTSMVLVAVSLLGTLSLLAWLSEHQKKDGVTVNVAGHHRALSEKLAKHALALSVPQEQSDRATTLDALQKTLDLWSDFHGRVVKEGSERSVRSSDNIERPFEDIQRDFSSVRQNVLEMLSVAKTPQNARRDEKLTQLAVSILNVQPSYHEKMDGIVRRHAREATSRDLTMQSLQAIAAFIVIALLLWTEFRNYCPAVRMAQSKMNDLQDAAETRREKEELSIDNTKLCTSERWLLQIASHLPEVLWVATADGSEIIYASPAYESIWGRSCENLYRQSRDWEDGIHPDDHGRVAKAFYQQAALGGYDEVFRVVRPDGAISWVHAKAFPVRDKTGEVCRITGFARDITESKRFEAQLLDINESLRFRTAFQQAVLNSTAYSVITTDASGLITTFNQGAERLLGYQANEVVGSVTLETIHEKDEVIRHAEMLTQELGQEVHPGFETLIAKARLGQADDHEWSYIRKDGSRVPVLLSVTGIRDDQKGSMGYLAIAKNITHRRESDRLLREAKQHAEQASAAKSEFLATMSHELRTPLNGVIGMAELLSGTDLSSKQRQFVDACRSSGETLLSLINDVLDFSKIEAGKLQLDLHDFDLEKLVTDTIDTMAWRATDKDLEMPCYIDSVSSTILKGDSVRLRQVLVNLVGNAIKFTESGEVALRTKTVAREDGQKRIRFAVSDTGIGIPADKLDRLFQSFSQVDASTTREYGGTGLGLSISQKLVELMGGTICVESEEGVGSTFWFEVPFAVVSESNEGLPRISPLAGRRTLIVDDNETNRQILTEYSGEWGAASVAEASVDAALSAIEQAKADGVPFEIVLTDYNMPERNGLDLARALQSHSGLVVLLLGSTDIPLEPEELREHGISASLRKPFRRQELHDVICSLLSKGEKKPASADPSSMTQAALPASHILLAEDNRINQMYMVELMKQLGCTCDTVANGREATEAVQQKTYNLVLMDCQMPEIDGFEATRSIRRMEANGLLDSRLPIVALTANALKGDRQRCLDVGMDDYLAKPVRKEQVISVFERLLTGTQEHSPEIGEPVESVNHVKDLSEPGPIDAESLLERCFGNLEFAESLLDEFASSAVHRVEEIQQHVIQQNIAAAAEAAHALKGAAGTLCAESIQKLAEDIEQAGHSSDIDKVEAALNDLAAEMQRCLDYVPQLRQELNTVKKWGR